MIIIYYLHNISGSMTEHSWQDCEEGDEQLWPLGDVGCQ